MKPAFILLIYSVGVISWPVDLQNTVKPNTTLEPNTSEKIEIEFRKFGRAIINSYDGLKAIAKWAIGEKLKANKETKADVEKLLKEKNAETIKNALLSSNLESLKWAYSFVILKNRIELYGARFSKGCTMRTAELASFLQIDSAKLDNFASRIVKKVEDFKENNPWGDTGTLKVEDFQAH